MKACPHCDTKLPDEMTFCPYCMQKLIEEQPVAAPPSEKRTGWLWAATGAVLVLLLVGALLLGDFGRQLPSIGVGGTTGTAGATTTTTTVPHGVVPPAGGGATSGSTTSSTDTETPRPTDIQGGDADCEHSWQPIVQTVEHDEVGHYDQVLTGYETVTFYKCAVCYDDKFSTLAEYYEHFDKVEMAASDALIVVFRERYETGTKQQAVYDKKWVVDQEAYTETVTVGHRCDTCGAIKAK